MIHRSCPSEAPARLAVPPSSARPSPDAGLTYILGEIIPPAGTIETVADGISWARIPLPIALDHINIWLLDDGQMAQPCLTLVDTGMVSEPAHNAWEKLLAGPLSGRSITRVIGTHFHGDHVGLAGALCARFDATLWMTREEYLSGRLLDVEKQFFPIQDVVDFWRAAGWSEPQIAAALAAKQHILRPLRGPLPSRYRRIQDGDLITIGGRSWRIIVGHGHSPEHAAMWDEQGGILIAGDHVLPRISTNVSMNLAEPYGDPLGEWLASIDRLLELPSDTLVLPSHGKPFRGLHLRLERLRDDHLRSLDELAAHIASPRTVMDCLHVLFHRDIAAGELPLATGEAFAHLRRLEVEGRAVRRVDDGAVYFVAA